MINKLIKSTLAFVLALGLFSGNAFAATVNLTLTGTVDTAINWGGLNATDPITADLVLDLDSIAYVGVGYETFFFTGANTIDITAGTHSFDESMDSDLNSSISFIDGELFDLNFGALFGVNGAAEEFDSFGLYVLADRSVTVGKGGNAVTTDYTLGASWNVATLSPVPVPAALWLMGSGLIGLAGVARRKQK